MAALQLEQSRTAPPRETDELWNHPLWANCRQSTIEQLLQQSVRRNFSPREVIVLEKTPADFLHVVVSGSVAGFSPVLSQDQICGTLARPSWVTRLFGFPVAGFEPVSGPSEAYGQDRGKDKRTAKRAPAAHRKNPAAKAAIFTERKPAHNPQ